MKTIGGRFLTRKPTLLVNEQPSLVDTSAPLDVSPVMPRRFPTLPMLAVVAGLLAYALVVEFCSRWVMP